MDLREAYDRVVPYLDGGDNAREAMEYLGMAVSVFVDRVSELERQVESLRLDLLSFGRSSTR